MAETKTEKDIYPKDIYSSAQVDAIRARRLKNKRVVSCDKTEDATNYYLTTVYRVV